MSLFMPVCFSDTGGVVAFCE